jgi:hypothetical protein
MRLLRAVKEIIQRAGAVSVPDVVILPALGSGAQRGHDARKERGGQVLRLRGARASHANAVVLFASHLECMTCVRRVQRRQLVCQRSDSGAHACSSRQQRTSPPCSGSK